MTSRMVPEEETTMGGKKCKWRGCPSTSTFKSIEEFLEHVLAEHIPTVEQDEDGEDEVVCKWGQCETGTIRGDLTAKTEWVTTHFKTRHAQGAKMHKCLFNGCKATRRTSGQLEAHVRSAHPVVVKKKETKPKECTPKPGPSGNGLPTIWTVVDGKITWADPPVVTKKTIVHYADGPRYVYPSGCGRCNYDDNESELASDEYWSTIEYSDDERTKRRSWRPPADHYLGSGPPKFTFPKWYNRNNPPETDSEEEERRRRPKRVKRKMLTKKPKISNKRDNLNAVIEKVEANRAKTMEEKEMEKSKDWVGSPWHKYLEAEKEKQRKREEERELKSIPQLKKEPKKSPRKRQLEEMPTLTRQDAVVVKSEHLPTPSTTSAIIRRPLTVLNDDPEDVMSSEEGFTFVVVKGSPISQKTMEEDVNVFRSPQKTTEAVEKSPRRPGRPRKSENSPNKAEDVVKNKKTSEKPKKRPSRACRVLGSMEEVPFDVEIGVEFESIPTKKRKIESDSEEEDDSDDEEYHEPKRSPRKLVRC